ncbi:chloride channel [Catenaria anguillulae PL171]|uniref:Chloride channel protein n=1 Tax=Catenaria anguillulae PL171 TaxID=765915 RepID=A0A1Y2HBC7_9FUNG|nr:chloride channel [Catenaria anguillulae PL171]
MSNTQPHGSKGKEKAKAEFSAAGLPPLPAWDHLDTATNGHGNDQHGSNGHHDSRDSSIPLPPSLRPSNRSKSPTSFLRAQLEADAFVDLHHLQRHHASTAVSATASAANSAPNSAHPLAANGTDRPQSFAFPPAQSTRASDPPNPGEPSFPSDSVAGVQGAAAAATAEAGGRRYVEFSTLDWMNDLRRRGNSGTHSSSFESPDTWLAALAIGLLVGCVAAWLDVALEWASDLKEGVCYAGKIYMSKKKCCWEQWGPDGGCDDWYTWSRVVFGLHAFFPFDFIMFIGISALLAAAAVHITLQHSPAYGPASGIPEVKTVLGGFLMSRALTLHTGLVKAIALILSVSSGLSIGNKAPLVHIGACIGQTITQLIPRFRKDPAASTYLLSAASAAGLAVAFGSPIGGILYALEEVSTFFPLPVMGVSFFCCLMATLTLEAFDPFRTGTMVMFQVTHTRAWHLFELLPFTVLAIAGGLIGAYYNRWNVRIQLARERSVFCQERPGREVVYLAILTSVFGYWVSFTRGSMLELLGGLFRECKDENYFGMCNQESLVFTCILLVYTAIFRFSTSILTYGSHIPAGAFVPNMVVGACVGRILGIMVSAFQSSFPDWPIFASCQIYDQVCVTPGSYALLGAAAALTGVTRLTITVVVVLFELTGALNFVLPTILTVVIAKFAADMSGGSSNGLANLHIQLKHYPYMDNKDDPHLDFTAQDVMCPDDQLVVLRNGMTMKQVAEVLDRSPVSTFPVVDDFRRMGLEGCVAREDLLFAIATNPASQQLTSQDLPIYFYSPVPSPPTASSSASTTAMQTFIDVRSFTDQTPITVAPTTNGSFIYTLFAKLGLRYIFVKDNGAIVGLITRKDMIRATQLTLGGPLGVDRERGAAPDLDMHGRELQRRVGKLRKAAWRRAKRAAGAQGEHERAGSPVSSSSSSGGAGDGAVSPTAFFTSGQPAPTRLFSWAPEPVQAAANWTRDKVVSALGIGGISRDAGAYGPLRGMDDDPVAGGQTIRPVVAGGFMGMLRPSGVGAPGYRLTGDVGSGSASLEQDREDEGGMIALRGVSRASRP